MQAIQLFLKGNNNAEALKLFDNQLKEIRKQIKNIQVFPVFFHNFYYFALLLTLNPEEMSVRAQKILANYAKSTISGEDFYFEAIIYSILNNKQKKSYYQKPLS